MGIATKIVCFLFILGFVPSKVFANCTPSKKFKKFVIKKNLLNRPDIKSSLFEYAKKKSKSIECIEEMFKVILLDEAIKWKIQASINKCFDAPPGKSCPSKIRNEIFGHFTSIEKKVASLRTTSHLCKVSQTKNIASDKLAQDTVDILRVLNKLERLELNLQKIKIDCNETLSISVEDSPNLDYFKKLLSKGDKSSLDDFLVFWYPGDEELKDKPFDHHCNSYVYGNLDYLSEDCKPDVLYSWGPTVKLENMKKTMIDNQLWKGSPNPINNKATTLFMAKSPVVSFGYGDIAIRIKLKSGTPFPYEHHSMFNKGEKDYSKVDGVMMNRAWNKDYMLKNSSFINSWSFGTPQIYDEMVRDILRFKNKKSAEVYASNGTNDPSKGLDNLFQQKADRKDFSEKELKRKLLKHISMILNGEGKIHYQKGSCRNKELHYKTNKPTYSNPN